MRHPHGATMKDLESDPEKVERPAADVIDLVVTLPFAWFGIAPIFGHGNGTKGTLGIAVSYGVCSVVLLLFQGYWFRSFRKAPVLSSLALLMLAHLDQRVAHIP